jgi:hypothetical protein
MMLKARMSKLVIGDIYGFDNNIINLVFHDTIQCITGLIFGFLAKF